MARQENDLKRLVPLGTIGQNRSEHKIVLMLKYLFVKMFFLVEKW